MPDPLWKVKYAFGINNGKSRQWTMSFWNAAADMDKARAAASSMAAALNEITGHQTFVNGWTILDKTTPRAGFPVDGDDKGGATGNAKDSDNPTTAAYFRLSNTLTRFVKMELRGMPDAVTAKGGRLQQTDVVWQTALPAFKAELIGSTGGSTWRIRLADLTKLEKAITELALTTGLLTVTNHGFPVNTVVKVRVKGITTPKGINGQRNVFVVDANTLQLFSFPVPILGGPVKLVSTASVREVAYTVLPITSVEFVRTTTKKIKKAG